MQNVEVLAVTGDSWHPDRALIGIGGLIMQLSNLEVFQTELSRAARKRVA